MSPLTRHCRQAIVELLKRLEHESEVHSETYRVIRNDDKGKLQVCTVSPCRLANAVSKANSPSLTLSVSPSPLILHALFFCAPQILAQISGEAQRFGLPLDYEHRMWTEFIIQPNSSFATLRLLEARRRH
jgi:hypothetical protein